MMGRRPEDEQGREIDISTDSGPEGSERPGSGARSPNGSGALGAPEMFVEADGDTVPDQPIAGSTSSTPPEAFVDADDADAVDGQASSAQPEPVVDSRPALGSPESSGSEAADTPEMFIDPDEVAERGADAQLDTATGEQVEAERVAWYATLDDHEGDSAGGLEAPAEQPTDGESSDTGRETDADVEPEPVADRSVGAQHDDDQLPSPEGVVFTPRVTRDEPDKAESGLDSRLKTFLDQSERTPAGRAFYEPHDHTMRASAQAVQPDPDRYTVDMHGDPYYVYVGSRVPPRCRDVRMMW
jgi:hypothetical protein